MAKKNNKQIYTREVLFVCEQSKIAKNLVTQLTFHSSRDSNSFGFYRETLIMDYFFFIIISLRPTPPAAL